MITPWGYCGLFFDSALFWQGYFVPDPKTMDVEGAIRRYQAALRVVSQKLLVGRAFSAACESTALDIAMRDTHNTTLAELLAVIAHVNTIQFFFITGSLGEGGTITNVLELPATTIPQARHMVDVRATGLKLGLMEEQRNRGKDH